MRDVALDGKYWPPHRFDSCCGCIAYVSEAYSEKPKPKPAPPCKGKRCPDPYQPYAEANQPDGSFLCYSCRNR